MLGIIAEPPLIQAFIGDLLGSHHYFSSATTVLLHEFRPSAMPVLRYCHFGLLRAYTISNIITAAKRYILFARICCRRSLPQLLCNESSHIRYIHRLAEWSAQPCDPKECLPWPSEGDMRLNRPIRNTIRQSPCSSVRIPATRRRHTNPNPQDLCQVLPSRLRSASAHNIDLQIIAE
jgi:hypothetical protein